MIQIFYRLKVIDLFCQAVVIGQLPQRRESINFFLARYIKKMVIGLLIMAIKKQSNFLTESNYKKGDKMDNQKELKFRELLEKVAGRDIKIIAEIRDNASKNPENISFNDILDLKIDLELYGVENVKPGNKIYNCKG
jgi:hypothetical protein